LIVIIDYGVGNLGSIANMLKKVGARAAISADAEVIGGAEKLILPGVGAFDNGMENLHGRGLVEVLNRRVLQDRTPILGLCLGMQLFSQKSEEGNQAGLGWLDAVTVRFNAGREQSLKIPHMGWNYIQVRQAAPLLADLPDNRRFYFVHSYHLVSADERDVLACTAYGYEFPSIVQKDNIIGAQFHPEKSHKFGMQLLKNYAERA
jgi:imidazole glycerol-phosphate synthase subunit HisH